MISRIEDKFHDLQKNDQKGFGVFLTAGFPTFDSSLDIFKFRAIKYLQNLRVFHDL